MAANNNFNQKTFLHESECKRISDYFKNPKLYEQELTRRKGLLLEKLEMKKDGYSRTNLNVVSTSRGGGHSDITAMNATDSVLYEELLSPDVSIGDLLNIENEDISDIDKVYFILLRCRLLVGKVLEQYDEEIRDIEISLIEGQKKDDIAAKLLMSKATVYRRIEAFNKTIEDTILEVLQIYGYEDKDLIYS